MTVVLARVDNRLIHGQVLEGWIPRLRVSTVLVADDDVVGDALRQAIMEIAIPSRIQCKFLRIGEMKGYFDTGNSDHERILILFSGVREALEAIHQGVIIASLNVGNVHYEHGKRRITSSVSLNDEEMKWLDEIERRIPVDIRATPDDPVISLSELLSSGRDLTAIIGKPDGWKDRWPFNMFRR